MGFDPQTANLPLVNVHKRTTKVNIFMAAAVLVFFVLGASVIFWVHQRSKDDEPLPPAPAGARP